MATDTEERQHRVGENPADEEFKQLVDQPTRESADEEAAIKRAQEKPGETDDLAAGEAGAAKAAAEKPTGSTAEQESNPKSFGQEDRELRRDIRRQINKAGLNRIQIGLIGGGGILSIFAGFLMLTPFKIPGLMDLVHGAAGAAVENIVEHEAEKIFMMYILRGSIASVGNGNVIVRGNPIGDLFANLRTARFEDRLEKNWDIKIESAGRGKIRLIHRGQPLGDFGRLEELQEFFNRDLSYPEARRALKLVTKLEIPTARWHKRIKFAKFLRLKYIRFFGVSKKKDGDTPKDVIERNLNEVGEQSRENTRAGMKALFEEGDADIDDLRVASNTMTELADNGVAEAIDKTVAEGATKVVTKAITQAGIRAGTVATTSAVLTSTGVGIVLLASVADHYIADLSQDGKFFKVRARLIGDANARAFATWAGLGDQTKAEGLPEETQELFNNQLDGAEGSQSFNIYNSGEAKGVGIKSYHKINLNKDAEEALADFGAIYNSPLAIGLRLPLIALYEITNLFGEIVASGVTAVVNAIPCIPGLSAICPKEALAFVAEQFAKVWDYLSEFLGTSIDPFAVGEELFNAIAIGGTYAYGQFGQSELDLHEVTKATATQMRNRVAAERALINSALPFSERVLSLNNPHSLASTLTRRLPLPNPESGFSNLALAGANLAASLPLSIGSLFSGRASAAGDDTIEEMSGQPFIGVNDNELNQGIAPELFDGRSCTIKPEDNRYDPCAVQKTVIDTMNCSIALANCPEMEVHRVTASGIISGEATAILQRQTRLDPKWIPVIVAAAAEFGADPIAMAALMYWEHRGFPAYGEGAQPGESDTVGRGPWQIIRGSWPSWGGDYATNVYDPLIATRAAAEKVAAYGGTAGGIPIGTITQNFGKNTQPKTIATLAKNYNGGPATWREPAIATHDESGRRWLHPGGQWGAQKAGIIDDYIVAVNWAYYQIATGRALANANTAEFVQAGLQQAEAIKGFQVQASLPPGTTSYLEAIMKDGI